MNLFYDPEFSVDRPVLNAEESHHCIKVLRNTIGDPVSITNGKGIIWKGHIKSLEGKSVSVTVSGHFLSTPTNRRSIALVPPKSVDRLEWFVEKGTELGISDFYFLLSNHSERKKINLDRLRKKAISALKQSHNPHLPHIHPLCKWDELFELVDHYDNKRIAHISDSDSENDYKASGSCITLVGPEGGFTDEELKRASDKGFAPISLGKNILRTETAGIIALIL